MPFRDPTIDPVKRCGGAVEADGWNYTKDRRVRWKVNKDDSVRYQSNHGGKRYKNVKKASGERAKAKDADSAGKKKKKKKEESDDDVEDKAEEEEEDEEEELYENPDHRDARETIEVDLQTWNGEDFANAVKSQAYLELDEVRFLRTSPITYAVCSQITEEDAPAVNQRLMKEVEPDHPRRREFLRDLTTVPAGKRADRPYHGDKPYLVKALTYQLCQDKFWPDNEYKQPFVKYTRLATHKECFDSGRNFVAVAGVRGLAPQLFRDVRKIIGGDDDDAVGDGDRKRSSRKRKEKEKEKEKEKKKKAKEKR